MKKITTLLALLAFTFAGIAADQKCGKYNGRQLYLGEKGGCYYRAKGKDGKMEKVYVERNLCKNCK
ncbi:MAG: hypothetical protein NZM35_00860 [Chitinophagales bacterium]|nr:hypothetical protein [Chitinophagales bacterium]MDW8418975.1 hypothetical protein [Chitinophagales bacterium]